MKSLYSFVLLAVSGFYVNGQVICQSFSLGELSSRLKYLDVNEIGTLSFKKYSSFDFKDFKPVAGKVTSNYFEVGFNKKNEIREIVHYEVADSLSNYRMQVFDYPDFRIMNYGSGRDHQGEWGYTSAIFLMDKKAKSNYMINTKSVLDGSMIVETTGGANYGNLDELSVIMRLDENLFPTEIYRICDKRIVFMSTIKYKGREVDYEQARLFLSDRLHDQLKINESTCLDEIKRKIDDESPEMFFRIYPNEKTKMKNAPLWIFLGAPNYKW